MGAKVSVKSKVKLFLTFVLAQGPNPFFSFIGHGGLLGHGLGLGLGPGLDNHDFSEPGAFSTDSDTWPTFLKQSLSPQQLELQLVWIIVQQTGFKAGRLMQTLI